MGFAPEGREGLKREEVIAFDPGRHQQFPPAVTSTGGWVSEREKTNPEFSSTRGGGRAGLWALKRGPGRWSVTII